MPKVTLKWLEQQAKQLVKKHWSVVEIPKIILVTRKDAITSERNLDWDNHAGYYCSSIQTVVLNNENNERYTLRQIKRILLHELCHWRLHATGEPYRDSDERFARELIRVGLGRRHNSDEQSQLAAKLARKKKQEEYFEIIERNEDEVISIRMRHHRKNQDDFKRDLANTLIRIHNERDEDETIYPSEVAEKMQELYGYKIEPISVFGIVLSADGSYLGGDIGDRDDVERLLELLGVEPEVIEKKLGSVASDRI